ncbi:DUF3040 domain-containing protein [Streptomyces shenzhenensis]|uniref:DUF3040 domain-containing protein n=1 Tax=Streptomyces shenzhenensis TaxID=943815 RepID=UPI0037DA636B
MASPSPWGLLPWPWQGRPAPAPPRSSAPLARRRLRHLGLAAPLVRERPREGPRSLSQHDQRVLADIEQQLTEDDPYLTRMPSSFGKAPCASSSGTAARPFGSTRRSCRLPQYCSSWPSPFAVRPSSSRRWPWPASRHCRN